LFHVYILRSLRNGKLYIGHTDNLERHFAEHNNARGGKFSRLKGNKFWGCSRYPDCRLTLPVRAT